MSEEKDYQDDDDDRVVAYPVPPDRPDVRRCPGCWRAALANMTVPYVHELRPCYPDCFR